MFEQSVISSGPAGKRLWSAFAGVAGQGLVVAGIVVSSMVWPQAMPSLRAMLLVPTAPPGPGESAHKKPGAHAPTRVVARRTLPPGALVAPRSVPDQIHIVIDEPVEAADSGPSGPYVPGAIGGGGGPANNLLADLLHRAAEVAPPAPPVHNAEPVHAAPVIPRYRVGGLVREPRLIYRVEPRYPELAVRVRVSGVVELAGIIGPDGRIHELQASKGNALLVPAALEAVRQWRYDPPLLNNQPIEVSTVITVTFNLNR